MKTISYFEVFKVKVEGCVYHGTIRLHTANPKGYTADWRCPQNGKTGQLGYDLPECHLVKLAAQEEIRKNHHDTSRAA